MSSVDKLVISISGKGGTGKTLIAAIFLKNLIQTTKKEILVIDADPATNLPDVLDIPIEKTVGMIAHDLKKKIDKGTLSYTTSKGDLLESWVHDILVEGDRFDLLAMGRGEGEGCYCFINSVLTRIIDVLSKNYDITLLDMEAGLEHFSRRTDRDVDTLLIITDPSKMGFHTAQRIKELTTEVHINFKNIYLIGNRFPKDLEDELEAFARDLDIELIGIIPNDDNVAKYNLQGKSLLQLPEDSPAVRAVKSIAIKIGLIPQ